MLKATYTRPEPFRSGYSVVNNNQQSNQPTRRRNDKSYSSVIAQSIALLCVRDVFVEYGIIIDTDWVLTY